MKNIHIVLLLLALGGAITIYNFNKKSTDHITNYNIAVDHLNKKEFEQAIPYLIKAMESKPNESRIILALEEAYRETGQLERANEVRSKLLE